MQKKILILGFGVVGKSLLSFVSKNTNILHEKLFGQSSQELFDISIIDQRELTEQERDLIKISGANLIDLAHAGLECGRGWILDQVQDDKFSLEACIKSHDYILPSPGFNMNDYHAYDHKILCELDILDMFFKKPIIGITGSLGKTTVTGLLAKLLTYCDFDGPYRVACGGNIGTTAMLDLIVDQEASDVAVLELSSFQLERSKTCAPDIALWTNFFCNHLDRHKTAQEYFDAKWQLVKNQKKGQMSLFSIDMLTGQAAEFLKNNLKNLKSHICFVSTRPISSQEFLFLCNQCGAQVKIVHVRDNYLCELFFDGKLVQEDKIQERSLFNISVLPDSTFLENWLIILSALYYFGVNIKELEERFAAHKVPDEVCKIFSHRLERVTTINGVTFYNDSKSTVMEATYAAAKKLSGNNAPVHVIIGGLGKGVDRGSFTETLKNISNIKQVYCFGPDCAHLGACVICATLPEVLDKIFCETNSGDQVLFSPGGTSFDFFRNYQHRGDVFKELVLKKVSSV